MDRREALKKLAIGGAIAAGGSLVVSSNAIAQTTSGVVPAGIPVDGQPLPGVTMALSSGDRQLTFAAPQPPAGVTATYAWNIRRYTVSQPQVKGIKLTTGGRVIEQIGQPNCGPSGCVYYPGGATALTETIFKNASAADKKFKGGDTVDLGLMMSWRLSTGAQITAEFVLAARVGSGVSAAMVPGSYRIS